LYYYVQETGNARTKSRRLFLTDSYLICTTVKHRFVKHLKLKKSLVLLVPNLEIILSFQSLDFECTWWRLFQKHIVHTKFDIYVFIKLLNHCLISSIKSRYFRIYNFMTLKTCKNSKQNLWNSRIRIKFKQF